MKYTQNDLERAEALWGFGVSKPIAPTRAAVAELIADVRREALEECARFLHKADYHGARAELIRALLDEPKAEPKCHGCGTTTVDRSTCPMCSKVVCQSCAEAPSFRGYASCCDAPKAEPKCKVCGGYVQCTEHDRDYTNTHDFEPEEPGT